MSDITKAFEILVSMDPSQATGAFKSIVDSQEKTTSSFDKFLDFGAKFNQLWELIGKGADAVKALASGVIDLADSGGELNEVEGNFKKLAAGAGIAADEFNKTVKEMTDGSLSLREQMALTSEAIVKGLTNDQILAAYELAQKRADAGIGTIAENFNQAVDVIQKGAPRAAAALGVFVTEAESADSRAQKLRDVSATLGEGFFNFGDNLKSIITTIGDFKDRIGQAFNQSEAFQEIVELITDAVTEFGNSFDFAEIAKSFDFLIKASSSVLNAFGIDFNKIKGIFNTTFSGGLETVKSFTIGTVKATGEAFISIAKSFNSIIDGLNKVSGAFALFYNGVKYGFAQVGTFLEEVWKGTENELTGMLVRVLGRVDEFAAATSGVFGFEATEQITQLANALNNVYIEGSKGVAQLRKDNEAFLDELGADLEKNAEKAGHVYDGLKIDVPKATAGLDGIISTVSAIAPTIIDNASEGMAEATKKGYAEMKAAAEQFEKEEKERIKRLEDVTIGAFKKEIEQKKELFEIGLSADEKRFRREQEDNLELYKKELETRREFRIDNMTGIRFSGNVDQRELELREKALKEFRRSQEDAFDLFKQEQRKKERTEAEKLAEEFKNLVDSEKKKNQDYLERVQRGEIAPEQATELTTDNTEMVDSMEGVGEKVEKLTQKVAEQSQKQTVFKLKIEPTGNSALDVLLENLLATAEVRAEAELVEVIAG